MNSISGCLWGLVSDTAGHCKVSLRGRFDQELEKFGESGCQELNMFALVCDVELALSIEDIVDHVEIAGVSGVRCVQFTIKNLTHVGCVVFRDNVAWEETRKRVRVVVIGWVDIFNHYSDHIVGDPVLSWIQYILTDFEVTLQLPGTSLHPLIPRALSW